MCKIHKGKGSWALHVDFDDSDQLGLVVRADFAGLDLRMTLEGATANYIALAASADRQEKAWRVIQQEITEWINKKFPPVKENKP